jgi:hypothetical protein
LIGGKEITMRVHRSARVALILIAFAGFVLPAGGASSIIELIGADPHIYPQATNPGVYFSPDPAHLLAYQDVPAQVSVQIVNLNDGAIVVTPSSGTFTGPLSMTAAITCLTPPGPTCNLTGTGVFPSTGTFTEVANIRPVNARPTSGSLVITVVPSIQVTPSLTSSQPYGTIGSFLNVKITDVAPQDVTVAYLFSGSDAFTNADGTRNGTIVVPAGNTVTLPVFVDRLGVDAAGTYTGSIGFSVNGGGTVATTNISAEISALQCTLDDLAGKSFGGSIDAQTDGSQPTLLVGLGELTVNDNAGNVAINVTVDSPNATAATSGPVAGTLAVNPNCSYTLSTPLGVFQGFVADNGNFLVGVSASNGTLPFFNAFGNQPVRIHLDMVSQNLSAIVPQFLQQQVNYSALYNFIAAGMLEPGVFQAKGSIGSTPGTLFDSANAGGFQSFGSLIAAVNQFDIYGFDSGFQTGPGGLSFAMTGLQLPSAGETRVIGNGPGSSAGPLLRGVLKPTGSAPAAGPFSLYFYGEPSNPSSTQVIREAIQGTIVYTTQFLGSMTATRLTFDPTTGNAILTPMTASIQAGTAAGSFFFSESSGQYSCQTNADATFDCTNQGQTSSSGSPVSFVINGIGRPQQPGPYTMDSAAGPYIVSELRQSQAALSQLVVPENLTGLTLEPDGTLTGSRFTGLETQPIPVTGSWTLDRNSALITITMFTSGYAPVVLAGFYDPTGDTFLYFEEGPADVRMTLRPGR